MYDLESASQRMQDAIREDFDGIEFPLRAYTICLLDDQPFGARVFHWYKSKELLIKALNMIWLD